MYTPGEFVLEMLTVGLECSDRLILLPLRTDGADEDVGVLKIRGDVDSANGDQGRLELHFPPDDDAKLALDQFTDTYDAQTHDVKGDASPRLIGVLPFRVSGRPFRACSTR